MRALAVFVLGLLVVGAAWSPWIANHEALLLCEGGRWSAPALEAETRSEGLWSAVPLLLLAYSLRRRKRLALALVVTALVFGIAVAGIASSDFHSSGLGRYERLADGDFMLHAPELGAHDHALPLTEEIPPFEELRHPLGTDGTSRDLLARLLAAMRSTLAIAGLAALCSLILGVLFGAIAALGGRALDASVVFLIQVVMGLPLLHSLMAAEASFGASPWVAAFAIAALGWPATARLARVELSRVAGRPFIAAARASGRSALWILRRHLLPHAAPALSVQATLALVSAVRIESALAFLGLGVGSIGLSLGTMVRRGFESREEQALLLWLPLGVLSVGLLAVQALVEGETFTPQGCAKAGEASR